MPEPADFAARLRFDELLPFFVTGHISESDRLFMQSFISTNPSAQSALNFTLELGRIIRGTGFLRDPSVTLRNLLARFEALHKKNSLGPLSKLKTLGIKSTSPLMVAIVVLGGQAVYYGYKQLSQYQSAESSTQSASRVAVTLKTGASVAALTMVVEKFGGRIIHSADAEGVTKYFVEIIDNARVTAFIDALVDSGVAESAAVLMF